jgi:hypothetical protein
VRKNGEEQMSITGAFERGLEFIFKNHGLGLWWFASDAIGRRGWCFWAALWSECRGRGGGVGG